MSELTQWSLANSLPVCSNSQYTMAVGRRETHISTASNKDGFVCFIALI